MTTRVVSEAIAGRTVLVSETGIEALQFVGRAGGTTFLVGGARRGDDQLPSGPNPYEMLAASLGTCTAMSIRLFADRRQLALTRLQVAVAFHRGDDTHRNSFERRIFLDGYLSDEDRGALLQVADTCPVGRVLGADADINTYVEFSPDTWPESVEPKASERDPWDAWWADAQPNVDAD
jgi:putative redox protein